MIIIGHRGAAGLAPENTIAAMQAGMDAGAAMLEFDIRLTRDGIPVVIHDASTKRTHKQNIRVNRVTLAELQAATHDLPIPTLDEVLKTFFGKILLNIECKEAGAGIAALKVAKKYIKNDKDWWQVYFSSFYVSELRAIRNESTEAKLALLHKHNPFTFVQTPSDLNLTGVGFFQLTVNPLAISIAKKRGMKTYAYTVNSLTTAHILEREGIDAIVTNNPGKFVGKI